MAISKNLWEIIASSQDNLMDIKVVILEQRDFTGRLEHKMSALQFTNMCLSLLDWTGTMDFHHKAGVNWLTNARMSALAIQLLFDNGHRGNSVIITVCTCSLRPRSFQFSFVGLFLQLKIISCLLWSLQKLMLSFKVLISLFSPQSTYLTAPPETDIFGEHFALCVRSRFRYFSWDK